MDEQEFASDSEQSDEDYCPDQQNDSDNLSEVESDDNLDEPNTAARKSSKKSSSKKRKKSKTEAKSTDKLENVETTNGTDDDDKERADALWADFLGGTDPLPTKKTETTKRSNIETQVKEEPKREPKQEPQKKVVTEIFEFAGEKVAVTKELNESSVDSAKADMKSCGPSNSNNGRRIPFSGIKRTSGGGIGSVLGQLAKKNKISVLDKSKLDWDSFKRNAGIDEELQTFNKGKDGYLERQDFLERTDVRQFELEKSVRLSRRNNRNC